MYRLIALFCFSYLLAQFDEKIKTADQTIQLFMEAKHAPGLVIAIGIKDKVIWSKGYGYADMEQSVPMDPKLTKLRIGSVAKPITAVMIGQLYEQGKLDLDRDIRDYVPSFPKKAKGTITSRLLAGHLAGIRHYRGDEFMSRTHYPTVMEGLTIFKDDTLLHEVGSKYQYS
ncbi:MAG: beta-lactamase family protein, partial [Calditrichaeota bacterium]|nr:beta-lactamase family protein [Calditrichota bacterium]